MKWIILPGMDGSGDFFEPFLKVIPEDVEPVTIRFPRNEKFGYEELFQWLLKRLPREEPFLVVAESFSGPLGVRLAAARPAGMVGAVISASFVRHPLPRILRYLPVEWLFRSRLPEAAVRFLLGEGDMGAGLTRLFYQSIEYSPPDVVAHRARAALEVDESEALRTCALPLLFLQPTSDRLIRPRSTEFVRRLRPDVRIVSIAAPHFLLQLRPIECIRAIEGFCSDLERDLEAVRK